MYFLEIVMGIAQFKKNLTRWMCLALVVLNFPEIAAQNGEPPDPLQSFEQEFIKIIEKVQFSAVTIEIHANQNRRFSSGVILDEAGHIATVACSCKDSEKIYVRLGMGKKLPARLEGIDAATNLAILKIDEVDLKPVERGDSDQLQLGAFLIIVGNPYGLKNSVTYGIVSGLNRTVKMEEGWEVRLTGIIQTNASINPGDAGGLVVDSRGKFVGMVSSTLANSRKPTPSSASLYDLLETLRKMVENGDLSHSQAKKIMEELVANQVAHPKPIQGINFIVPSNSIYWVADQIIQNGEVRRGWVGIEVVDHDSGEGVMVTTVFQGSPAEQAGIFANDHLIKIDNLGISNSDFLLHKISHFCVNRRVCFTLKRTSREFDVLLNLAKQPK